MAVHLLRYRTVGWNGGGASGSPTPAGRSTGSARSSARCRSCWSGHSMGGRTACRVADDALVAGRRRPGALAPPGEPVGALAGKQLHAAHGRRDRITRPDDTRAYVERAGEVAPSAATFTDMGDRGHYLLRGIHAWNAFALDRVRQILAEDFIGPIGNISVRPGPDETELFHPRRSRYASRRNETVSFHPYRTTGDHRHDPRGRSRRRRSDPRVEGVREQEILDAALEVLGRGRLRPAHHGRRRPAGQGVQGDALPAVELQGHPRRRGARPRSRRAPVLPDTGDLRSDLVAAFCGMGGLTDHDTTATFGAVMTAVSTDPEFARRVPRAGGRAQGSRVAPDLRARSRSRRAPRRPRPRHRRSRLSPGSSSTACSCFGEQPDQALIERAIDQIILPAVRPQG